MLGEAEAGEKLAGLGESAANAGEFLDAFGGLGRGANGVVCQGLLDDLDMVDMSRWSTMSRLTLDESIQAAIAVFEEVSFGGGDSDAGDAGRLFAGVSEVHGPEDEPFASDGGIGVVIAIVADASVFVGGELGSIPSRDPWPSWEARKFADANRPDRDEEGKINSRRAGDKSASRCTHVPEIHRSDDAHPPNPGAPTILLPPGSFA